MTSTEDRLSSALRTDAARISATPDLPGIVSRSHRLRRRRLVASSVAAVAAVGLVASAVRDRGPEPSPAGVKPHALAPIAGSPLAMRVAASQVSLGWDVFIWGGAKTTVSYKAPKTGGVATSAAPAGTGPAPELLSDGAIYSADSNSWRKVSRSPLSARLNAPAVVTPRGVLVVGGGRVDSLMHADLRSGALYDPATDKWTAIPDAPFCPDRAVPQGSLVYAYGTTCDQSPAPKFGWYDLSQNRWHIGPLPLPVADTRQLFPYEGTVVALGRTGQTQSLGPRRDYWVTLDPLPASGNNSVPPAGTDVVTDFVTAWDATTLYAVGQVDFGRKGAAVYSMSGLGWVETGRLPLGINPAVQPPARFGVEASVQDGVLVWHSEHGVSWFESATFRGGFVATNGGGPMSAISSTPLVPVTGGRFLWWGGHTGESIPSTHQALSTGALLTLP